LRTWSTSIRSDLIVPALFTLPRSLVLEGGPLVSKPPAGTSLWLSTICQHKAHLRSCTACMPSTSWFLSPALGCHDLVTRPKCAGIFTLPPSLLRVYIQVKPHNLSRTRWPGNVAVRYMERKSLLHTHSPTHPFRRKLSTPFPFVT